jgi:hypothetical protein
VALLRAPSNVVPHGGAQRRQCQMQQWARMMGGQACLESRQCLAPQPILTLGDNPEDLRKMALKGWAQVRMRRVR